MSRSNSLAWPEMEKAQPTHNISIQIQDRDAFGAFCVALTNDNVPFSHRGFQTIVMAETQLGNLPFESRRLFTGLKTQNLIKTSTVSSVATGKRRLPTEQEAKELLRKFTAKRVVR